MIARLRGVLIECGDGEIIVDVHGVGYRLFVPDSTLRSVPLPGEEVSFYTHMNVREDSLHLYGFSTPAEKRLFETVLSVGGVGPRLALSILSNTTVDGFIRAVLGEDHRVLTKIPGVGKKIASRIVLELKDTFKSDAWTGLLAQESDMSTGGPIAGSVPVVVDAVEALIALGYRDDEAKEAVNRIVDSLDPDTMTVEQVITMALGQLDRVG